MARELEFIATPVFSPGARVIASPFQFLTSGDDHLRVESWSPLTGVRVDVHGRWQPRSGQPKAFAFSHAANSDRTRQRTDHALEEGFLLNLTVFASAGSPRIGQLFVSVKLIRGFTGAVIVLGVLLQGYVTSEQFLGWPGSPILSSMEGPGLTAAKSLTLPAAGVEISETVPTGALWELHTFYGELVTDATAADRRPLFLADNGVERLVHATQALTTPASTTTQYAWAQGMALQTGITADGPVQGLPTSTILSVGSRFRTLTQNLQAGDQWIEAKAIVREWLEVDA